MSQPKRHHYIPQLILRNFANDSDQIWIHRSGMGNAPRLTSVKKAFVEKDLNTVFDEDGARDVRIEQVFSKMESIAGPFFSHLLENVRSRVPTRLSEGAWRFWDRYFYYQIKRPPASLIAAERETDLDQVLLQTIAEEEEAGRLDPETKLQLLKPESRATLRQNARATALIRPPEPALRDLIASCGLTVLVIPRSELGTFVLGDIGIAYPSSTLHRYFTAIAPDVALVQSYQTRSIAIREVRDRAYVRKLNVETARQSIAIGGSSPEALQIALNRR